MPEIQLLEQSTIDKIAAGEVVERPSSVVKELVENAIDAKATAITVEIKDGGISFIRITDNGCGIPSAEIPLAFLRHSTSKIRSVEDLSTVTSLGFRGEAISSIAAVSQVELITKTSEELLGCRYVIEGSVEKACEEIGAPNGTTFLVRNLFYNTPARAKFLKTPQTEATYISSLMEHLALSHPNVSFRFIVNGQTKLNTAGNGNQKELIYHIYGRELAANLIEIHKEYDGLCIDGFIGKPIVARGNRNYETFFINGRYIKSKLISKSIEDAYKTHLMQHQYPFTVLHLRVDTKKLDVNVHPTKMELRFENGPEVYQKLLLAVEEGLSHKDFIPEVTLDEEKQKSEKPQREGLPKPPEPFETVRNRELLQENLKKHSAVPSSLTSFPQTAYLEEKTEKSNSESFSLPTQRKDDADLQLRETSVYEQKFLTETARAKHRIIGQVFATYWLVEFDGKLFIIDQHAAHEKVLFERTMKDFAKKEFTSQQLSPPLVVTLSMREEEMLKKFMSAFEQLGYQIEHFGGNEYSVCAVPANLYSLNEKQLFLELLDDLSEETGLKTKDAVLDKVATMSCKAAVKGNQKLSVAEMDTLIGELLECENPYQCPHGRPTIISISKYELEKKFKRIV